MIKKLRIYLHRLQAAWLYDRAEVAQAELDYLTSTEQERINRITVRATFHEERIKAIEKRPGQGILALIPTKGK